eukprot:CAMPEP_0174749458 /NCGR_PEP_ID=MMETSP1094-20130205/95766_1 /TAXON_ID=156173 /ORGANISM="Chrysochromulina brevifilum, Strain UTEX LB 985" /LENGTH=98 /DNA_ID=CAMNT_0015954669 /DNA_START=301 /DNA_END=594 /DNA_ORIENTATION=+
MHPHESRPGRARYEPLDVLLHVHPDVLELADHRLHPLDRALLHNELRRPTDALVGDAPLPVQALTLHVAKQCLASQLHLLLGQPVAPDVVVACCVEGA